MVVILMIVLLVNLGGVTIESFKARNVDLAWRLGVVRLIESEEGDSRDEFEGDREGVGIRRWCHGHGGGRDACPSLWGKGHDLVVRRLN